MPVYDICFSADDNYSEQLAVAITSIIKNSSNDEIFNFYILDGDISEYNLSRLNDLKRFKDFNIKFIKMNYGDFETCPMLKDKDESYCDYHVTKPTYFRFKIPSLFPDLDKILYLDPDIIVSDSLKELYNTTLNDFYCGMILDVDYKKEAERLNLKDYFNAGVMLINLKKWREDNIEQKLFDFVKNKSEILLWQDQDVFNLVFENKTLKLSEKWNYQIPKEDFDNDKKLFEKLKNVVILHFAGRFKPWLNFCGSAVFEIYYNYLLQINWLDNLYKYKQEFFLHNLKKELGDDLVIEKVEKIYKYIEYKHNDILNILDIKFSNSDKVYFTEQSKIYEYINLKHQEALNTCNQQIDEFKKKLYCQEDLIKKLEERLNNIEK